MSECVYVYMYVCMCVCMCMYARSCVHVMWVFIHVTQIFINVFMCVYVFLCVCCLSVKAQAVVKKKVVPPPRPNSEIKKQKPQRQFMKRCDELLNLKAKHGMSDSLRAKVTSFLHSAGQEKNKTLGELQQLEKLRLTLQEGFSFTRQLHQAIRVNASPKIAPFANAPIDSPKIAPSANAPIDAAVPPQDAAKALEHRKLHSLQQALLRVWNYRHLYNVIRSQAELAYRTAAPPARIPDMMIQVL